jgi:hypothetical protein
MEKLLQLYRLADLSSALGVSQGAYMPLLSLLPLNA